MPGGDPASHAEPGMLSVTTNSRTASLRLGRYRGVGAIGDY